MQRATRAAAMIAAAAGLAFNSLSTQAQSYPAKPFRFILPFPPGGPTDLVGRMTAQKLGEQLGVNVIADSRPGAGGNLGLELAAKSPPDGYTIVLASPVISLAPLLYKKLNYDPQKVPDTKSRFVSNGVDPLHPTPEQFAQYIRSEATRFAKVVKAAGIQPE